MSNKINSLEWYCIFAFAHGNTEPLPVVFFKYRGTTMLNENGNQGRDEIHSQLIAIVCLKKTMVNIVIGRVVVSYYITFFPKQLSR